MDYLLERGGVIEQVLPEKLPWIISQIQKS